MTELDLPQITFTRYLELLKRRRWQVIPVTLVGLLVGTVVAFLIPRYYVAEAVFVFQGGATLDPNAEDPMYVAATDARVEIPALVEAILVDKIEVEYRDENKAKRTGRLQWPEASDRGFVDAVKGRVFVVPVSNVMKAVNKINLSVQYSDTDGERARDLANYLVGAWRQETIKRLETQGARELDDLNRRVREAGEAKRAAETELRNHMVAHGLTELSDSQGRGRRDRNPLIVERSEQNRELSRLAQQEARLQRQIESFQIMLSNGTIPEKITRAQVGQVDVALEQRYQELIEAQRIAKRRLDNMHESNPNRRAAEARLAETERQLEEVIEKLGAAQEIEVDNPAYQTKLEQLTQWRAELSGAVSAKAVGEARLAEIEEQLEKMPEIMSRMQQLERDVERRDQQLAEVSVAQREAQGRFNMLRNRQAVRVIAPARTPPRPTDPNIALVAAAGCLIALATAIGLILLLDYLQSAFKSLEDVEHALPVPVLGALSHLETHEERTRSVAHRRRVSLAAGVFLFLSLSVVTIYFVDKARLPTVVADALDVILGTSAGEPAAK